MWRDPPEYYNVSVLAYTPSVPPELLRPAGGMTAKGHVALMLDQLRAIRAALALAHALDRCAMARLGCP